MIHFIRVSPPLRPRNGTAPSIGGTLPTLETCFEVTFTLFSVRGLYFLLPNILLSCVVPWQYTTGTCVFYVHRGMRAFLTCSCIQPTYTKWHCAGTLYFTITYIFFTVTTKVHSIIIIIIQWYQRPKILGEVVKIWAKSLVQQLLGPLPKNVSVPLSRADVE